LWGIFVKIVKIHVGRLCTREELVKFLKARVRARIMVMISGSDVQ